MEARTNLMRALSPAGKRWVRVTHFHIAGWATVLLTLFSLLVAPGGSTYRWAFLFLVPLVWGLYALREPLALRRGHFVLWVAALLFHELGALGFYSRTLLGLRFDTYVHFIFGCVAGLILGQALRVRLGLSRWALWLGVSLVVLGLGGLHELIECATTLVLGPEKGMLKMRPDQPFDTQKDLLNNLLGALSAMAYLALTQSRAGRTRPQV